MSRCGKVYYKEHFCGVLNETDGGYSFEYNKKYLLEIETKGVSLTLPKREEMYFSRTLFAFFDGLIPEGWLLNIVEKNWKINFKDRFGLLLMCCKDCIGSVSIVEKYEEL